jgi:hypothetical protein
VTKRAFVYENGNMVWIDGYIGSNVIDGEHVGSSLKTKKGVSIAQPNAPIDLSDVVYKTVFDAEINKCVSEKARYRSILHHACHSVMDQ